MNVLKQKTLDLIKMMPDEKMPYVFNIVQNVFALADEGMQNDEGENVFAALMSFHKIIAPTEV